MRKLDVHALTQEERTALGTLGRFKDNPELLRKAIVYLEASTKKE